VSDTDVTRVKLKLTSPLLVPAAYIVYGGINLAVFLLTGLTMTHMAVLGLLAIVAGVGLQYKKDWFFWVALAVTPLLITTGLTTFIASVGFSGFNPNTPGLLLNLGLAAYELLALHLFVLLLTKKQTFLGS
jgi:hypothetical protein